MAWSQALLLAAAPAREYRALMLAGPAESSWARAFKVPALIAILLGISMSIAATERITLSLAFSGAVCWSFVPLLQLATAAALVGSVRERPVGMARGVELVFAGHGPWSLWVVAVAAYQTISGDQAAIMASSVVPAAFTARILSAFGREVLGLSPWAARRRVLAHQLSTALLIVIYVELATQLSARIIGMIDR